MVTAISTVQAITAQTQGISTQAAQVSGFHAAFVTGAGITIFAFLIVLIGLSQRGQRRRHISP
ncbi:MAG TPA: hypothetical protein VFN35_14325 [Ktedonobacteraceae bacterium]|nr:hypothetical protein [Ktedonobacteraceae bacterium]